MWAFALIPSILLPLHDIKTSGTCSGQDYSFARVELEPGHRQLGKHSKQETCHPVMSLSTLEQGSSQASVYPTLGGMTVSAIFLTAYLAFWAMIRLNWL